MSVNLAIANIALDTASVSRQGFGTILFVGQHNYFAERVRAYTSTKSMSEDGIDSNHPIFQAAAGAFSQTPSPRELLIGRQAVASHLGLSEDTPVEGKLYSFSLTTPTGTDTFEVTGAAVASAVTPLSTQASGAVELIPVNPSSLSHQISFGGDPVSGSLAVEVKYAAGANYEPLLDQDGSTPVVIDLSQPETFNIDTALASLRFTPTSVVGDYKAIIASGGETGESIATQFVNLIRQSPLAADLEITVLDQGNAAQLEVDTLNGAWFTVSNLVNLEESFGTSTETAADVVAAIEAEDESWYYITAQEKSNKFVTDMATLIESKLKVYATSLDELSVFEPVSTGTAVDLKDGNFFRTYNIYHQEAKTTFPEVARIAEAAFAVTGSISYGNRRVSAVPVSLNAAGKPLTTTQQNKLKAINSDFFARVGSDANADPIIGVVGKVASGEWLDNIVGRDNMQVDIEADFNTFLINQKNGKVAFNNKGINQIRGVLDTVLSQYTPEGTHNFINSDYSIKVADAADVPQQDKAARVFKQISFTATLTNAIHMVEITGTLSY